MVRTFNDNNTLPQGLNAEIEPGVIDHDGPGFIDGYEDEKGDFAPLPRAERLTPPTHPGTILRELYLPGVGINLTELAGRLNVSRRTISMIVTEARPVTVDMANRLARAFETSPDFWLNLQTRRDVWEANHEHKSEYEKIVPLERKAA